MLRVYLSGLGCVYDNRIEFDRFVCLNFIETKSTPKNKNWTIFRANCSNCCAPSNSTHYTLTTNPRGNNVIWIENTTILPLFVFELCPSSLFQQIYSVCFLFSHSVFVHFLALATYTLVTHSVIGVRVTCRLFAAMFFTIYPLMYVKRNK